MLSKNRRFPNRWMKSVTKEEMSASERLVWRTINEHHHTNPDAWPSFQTIADETGLSRRAIYGSILPSLEKKNLVGVTHNGSTREANRYICMIPEVWLQRMELGNSVPQVGKPVPQGREASSPALGKSVPPKGSGGRNQGSLSMKSAPATPKSTSSEPPPEEQSQTKWGAKLRKKGYPSAEVLVNLLNLKEKPGNIEWNWLMHCERFGNNRDPQLVRDVVYWFPGYPSKKKGGQPYWSFVNSMDLVEKHWDKMEAQCIEDLNGSRRLMSVT